MAAASLPSMVSCDVDNTSVSSGDITSGGKFVPNKHCVEATIASRVTGASTETVNNPCNQKIFPSGFKFEIKHDDSIDSVNKLANMILSASAIGYADIAPIKWRERPKAVAGAAVSNGIDDSFEILKNQLSDGLPQEDYDYIRSKFYEDRGFYHLVQSQNFTSVSPEVRSAFIAVLKAFDHSPDTQRNLTGLFYIPSRDSKSALMHQNPEGKSLCNIFADYLTGNQEGYEQRLKMVAEVTDIIFDSSKAINMENTCGPVSILGTLADTDATVIFDMAKGLLGDSKSYKCKQGLVLNLPDNFDYDDKSETGNLAARAIAEALMERARVDFRNLSGETEIAAPNKRGMYLYTIINVLGSIYGKEFIETNKITAEEIYKYLKQDQTGNIPLIFAYTPNHIFSIADDHEGKILTIGDPNPSAGSGNSTMFKNLVSNHTQKTTSTSFLGDQAESYILSKETYERIMGLHEFQSDKTE